MKYVDALVAFSEVPDEISLCIDISNCPHQCKNCHSAYLQQDKGEELTEEALKELIAENYGISCICLMGGDATPEEVNNMAIFIKTVFPWLKTAWYSGSDKLNEIIAGNLQNWNYIKIGSYKEEAGPLTSKTTNQKFYEVTVIDKECILKDITYKFWKR